jgi:hypothetical protein
MRNCSTGFSLMSLPIETHLELSSFEIFRTKKDPRNVGNEKVVHLYCNHFERKLMLPSIRFSPTGYFLAGLGTATPRKKRGGAGPRAVAGSGAKVESKRQPNKIAKRPLGCLLGKLMLGASLEGKHEKKKKVFFFFKAAFS